MTTVPPSIETELLLKVFVGPELEIHRPSAQSETGPAWRRLEDDAQVKIAIENPCTSRLRLVAQDAAGEGISAPPWTVTMSTRVDGGPWTSLTDQSASEGDFKSGDFEVTDVPRTYRFTVELTGSGLSVHHEITVARYKEADDNPFDDIIYDPDDVDPDTSPPGGSPGSVNVAIVSP